MWVSSSVVSLTPCLLLCSHKACCCSLASASQFGLIFTEHEPNGVSQEEYKKEQMNLKKMFLLLDIKRKVVH